MADVEAVDELREFKSALGALGGAFPDIACVGWRCRGKGDVGIEGGDVVCCETQG